MPDCVFAKVPVNSKFLISGIEHVFLNCEDVAIISNSGDCVVAPGPGVQFSFPVIIVPLVTMLLPSFSAYDIMAPPVFLSIPDPTGSDI